MSPAGKPIFHLRVEDGAVKEISVHGTPRSVYDALPATEDTHGGFCWKTVAGVTFHPTPTQGA